MVTHSHYSYLHAIRDSISCRRERSIRYIMNTYLICESVSFFEIGAVQLRSVKRHRSEIIVLNRTEAIAGMLFKPAKKLCGVWASLSLLLINPDYLLPFLMRLFYLSFLYQIRQITFLQFFKNYNPLCYALHK